MSNSMPPIKPVAHLTEEDRLHISQLAQQAADWLWLFDLSRFVLPTEPTIDDKLNMIFALHHMPDFRSYVQPFLRSDERITAFEDAVADRLFEVIGQKASSHV